MIDFLFGITDGDVIYDLETFPNFYSIGLTHVTTKQRWYFEISARQNDMFIFCQFLTTMSQFNCRMVGFNNVAFDYPVIHYIHKNQRVGITVTDIYNKAMSIINTSFNNRFANMVRESDWIVPQIDLLKIHHFDNVSKFTSLKILEFNMRMDSIEDLPFAPGTTLTEEQMQIVADYMWHDIDATEMFYNESLPQIKFREELSEKYDRNFMNHNDTKIGAEIFIQQLEKNKPGCCYDKSSGKRIIQQTPRDEIIISELIPEYIQFEHPEFQRIYDWLNQQVITETKSVFKDINCNVGGITYHFGTGGLHASVEWASFHAEPCRRIQVRDVASMYPNIAIQNNFFPEHLGDTFCTIYEEMYKERKSHEKGTPENAMLKLALNGTYGNSNNKYSPFYDPKFTMSITLVGQLSLAMLCDKLNKAPNLQIIFANTDGVCYICDDSEIQYVDAVCNWWEQVTKLELETDEVSRIWVRDVNSYIQEYAE